jgi:hypothetical protein
MHNAWKKSKTGTEKRDEKRKRDLCKAAADPKQSRLFEPVPHKSARVATFDDHEAASSSGLTAGTSSSCHTTHPTDPSLHTPSNFESVQPAGATNEPDTLLSSDTHGHSFEPEQHEKRSECILLQFHFTIIAIIYWGWGLLYYM